MASAFEVRLAVRSNFAMNLAGREARPVKQKDWGGQVLNLDIDRIENKQMRNVKNKDLTPFLLVERSQT